MCSLYCFYYVTIFLHFSQHNNPAFFQLKSATFCVIMVCICILYARLKIFLLLNAVILRIVKTFSLIECYIPMHYFSIYRDLIFKFSYFPITLMCILFYASPFEIAVGSWAGKAAEENLSVGYHHFPFRFSDRIRNLYQYQRWTGCKWT